MSVHQRGENWRARVMVRGKRTSRTFEARGDAEAWASRMKRRMLLNSEIGSGQLASLLPKRVLEALSAAEYSRLDITDGATPIPTSCGVYFLMLGGEIVYVGKSTDIFLRISRHRRDGRKFDAYNFLLCERERLAEMETMYIEALMPSQNRQF